MYTISLFLPIELGDCRLILNRPAQAKLFHSLIPMAAAAAKQTAALTAQLAALSESINLLVATLRESIDKQTNNTDKRNAMVLDQATTLQSFSNTIEDTKQKILDLAHFYI